MVDTESTDRQGPLVLDAEVAQSTVTDAEVIPNAPVEDLEPPSAAAEKVKTLPDVEKRAVVKATNLQVEVAEKSRAQRIRQALVDFKNRSALNLPLDL